MPAKPRPFAARSALAACLVLAGVACATPQTLVPNRGFVQPLGRTHELVGRIYAPGAGSFVDADALRDAVEGARVLVLGESHDNRDHHRLQATLVDWFLDVHPVAAVGFEMLDEEVRPALEAAPRDPDALARAVRWEESGWPEFDQYRPIFEVALARPARILAAHPSRVNVRASLSGLDEAEARRLHLDRPLPAASLRQLEREIRDSHCGHAPDAMVTGMVRAQSYKDAFMARALLDAGVPAVLITGRGHARTDRAVPHFLRSFGAGDVLSVAFVEVDDAGTTPADYELGVYDYAVFTPRTSDEDPCERFQRQLEQMRARHPSPQ